MYEILNSVINNVMPIYNKLCIEIYDINYDLYNKITHFINDTNETITQESIDIINTNTDTYNYNDVYASSNVDITYFITVQIVFYYTVTIFIFIVLIKQYINLNDIRSNNLNYKRIYNVNAKQINNVNNKQINNVNNDNDNNDNVNENKTDDKKLYLYSLIEITRNNADIMSKLKVNTNYVVILRVKLKQYVQMKHTQYELHSKYLKINNDEKDFITKDMYMIMGFNFNNQHKNFANIIVEYINHLNSISDTQFKNEDFLIVAIGSVNNNTSCSFVHGIKNIKYESFNLIDIIFNLKNNNYIKYSLTLPIHNINDMVLDIFNDTVFISKQYSIDKNNYEKWSGILLNEINEW